MKTLLLLTTVVFALYVFPSCTFAQSTYKTAAGLEIDFGRGSTLAGPTLKNFFTNHQALQVDVLLGSNYFSLGAFYQYHLAIKKTSALKFYLGLGPEVFVGLRNDAGVSLRPMAGFDYKVTKLPLSITFDLKPSLLLGSSSEFEVNRFGLGARYAFR
ncbi:MAG: hypothetical protein EOP43_05455 [Sphingobacteriaceae bacterium]|nr:MAG: hypothetical protein EOP43_05455 [Sphingobacteriaceae bacterium]